jgi:uncharacterized Fe-S cluster-containing radical SAM superfamily protein
MHKPHILYIQLPLLDNDASGTGENFPFAAAYLDHALRNSPEAEFHTSQIAPTAWDLLDTRHLGEQILATGADIVACTLYLWNVERTMRLAELLRARKPGIRIFAGGPETAREHPLLFSRPAFDAVVTGEGEHVFTALLASWRTGSRCNFSNVGQPGKDGWEWGDGPPPSVDLARAQPGETALMACVQNRPVVYLETVRGCPLTCTYCRYYQLHTGLRALEPEHVIRRITRLRELGAREIRFVDPTFNARKNFRQLLSQLAELNRDRALSFFAEIRAGTLTTEEARLIGEAGFAEVEIGIQSIDPQVLKNINRPGDPARTSEAIRTLIAAGVRVTLDVMYGLPGQTPEDVIRSIAWCLAFGDGVQVQCMQTLLLPGTVLRAQAEQWNLHFNPRPPYPIESTPDFLADDITETEIFLSEHPRLPADPRTPRFCGQRLSGMFKERHRLEMDQLALPMPGKQNRRAITFAGADLFIHRDEIARAIGRAIADDPDMLWQFILEPEFEEPLDLIHVIAGAIRQAPRHLLDRFASAAAFDRTVSRRLFIRIRHPEAFSSDWRSAANELLHHYFD